MGNDVVSDVLQTVRLSGAVFFDVAASSPWVAEAPLSAAVAPLVMPNAQHIIEYHVVTSGYGWASLIDETEPDVRLGPGSVIMFPQGDPHVLSSEQGMRAKPNLGIFNQPKNLSPPYYLEQFGDGPAEIRLICGFLGCDLVPFNPIISNLPRMIHVPEGYVQDNGWLSHLIAAITAETKKGRVGSSSVLSRLSELLFIEVVRRYAESLSENAPGWLAALNDRHLGRAIQLLHHQPTRPWTLESLAREVGTSRTVLANRFAEQLGVAPIKYLTSWRMQMAASMLSSTHLPINRVAADVGYESEAAFSRAFKRCMNLSPGAWRTQQNGVVPEQATT